MKKVTEDFINSYFEITKEIFSIGKSKNIFLGPSKIFKQYSRDDFKNVLEDPYWIKARDYNLFFYRSNILTTPERSVLIKGLIKSMFCLDHDNLDLVIKHADGILLWQAIRSCSDVRLKVLSKRGLSSRSIKVRKEAAKYCTFDLLINKALKDSRKEVREIAIKRAGLHNVADLLLNDKSVNIRLDAAIAANRGDIIIEIFKKDADKIDLEKHLPYSVRSRMMKVIGKMSKKEVTYNLDVMDAGALVKALIEAKLS